MKTYQKIIAGIGIGLCVGLLDYLTPKYPESQWKCNEVFFYGFNFYKKDEDKNIEIMYRVCYTGNFVDKENPNIRLSIYKPYNLTIDGYTDLEHITIWDNSYGKNKVDGNINWFSAHHKEISGYIEFDDAGNVLNKRWDFEKCSNNDLQKILKWANKKFKDIQDELRGKFGNKIEIPYKNESIEKILEEFE